MDRAFVYRALLTLANLVYADSMFFPVVPVFFSGCYHVSAPLSHVSGGGGSDDGSDNSGSDGGGKSDNNGGVKNRDCTCMYSLHNPQNTAD